MTDYRRKRSHDSLDVENAKDRRLKKRPYIQNNYEQICASGSSQVQVGDVYHVSQHSAWTREQICHQMFKTSSYEQHKDRNPLRVNGTCQWVLNNPYFKSWRQGTHNSLLWVSADPGCGKSVLSRSLIDRDLQKSEPTSVCYFFFKDNQEQDNLATALCALLHQLFAQQPGLIVHAIPSWETNGEKKLLEETLELWRIFQRSVADAAAAPVICVLDALDECQDDDRRQLIGLLCELQEKRPQDNYTNGLRVLVTSRPYDNVQRWFQPIMKQWPRIRLRGEDENGQINREINLVLNKQVEELASELSLSNSTRRHLQDQLLNMRHRTYLWLHLAIDEIRQKYANSLYHDEVAISSLPSSVEEAYERILQKINGEQASNARQILIIIIGARRALTIEEMAQALGAEKAHRQDSVMVVPIDTQHLEKQIRHWCGLFVFIQQSRLFLIHQTAKEFLLSTNSAPTPHSSIWRSSLTTTLVERQMTSICTTYLCKPRQILQRHQNDHIHSECDYSYSLNHSLNHNMYIDSFWKYCAIYWVSHSQD